jgi:hypothetical protein
MDSCLSDYVLTAFAATGLFLRGGERQKIDFSRARNDGIKDEILNQVQDDGLKVDVRYWMNTRRDV